MVHDVLEWKGYIGVGYFLVAVFFDLTDQILFAIGCGVGAPYLTIGTILERDDHNLGTGIRNLLNVFGQSLDYRIIDIGSAVISFHGEGDIPQIGAPFILEPLAL